MTVWLIWWFVVSIVVGGALIAISVGLVRRMTVLGRALQRFQDEVRPVAREIAREGARASERAEGIGGKTPSPRS